MDFQSHWPRALMASMLEGEGVRVGVVVREDVISEGREARKALSMFIVRGTCAPPLSVFLRGRQGEEGEGTRRHHLRH